MFRLLFSLVLTLISVVNVHAQVFTDNFNRPDAPDLGPNWQVIGTGSATRVIGNQAGNVAGANNLSLVTSANFSSTYDNTVVTADVSHSATGGVAFVALALGHNGVAAGGNGLFIKVQSNTAAGTQFDFIGFYTGIGVGTTTFWSDPPVFFAATTPFASARMRVFASDATTINLTLDTNFDGVPDQTFTRHLNLGTMTFGTQAGLSVFGTTAFADNYSVTPAPEPGSLLLVGSGVVLGGRFLRRRRA